MFFLLSKILTYLLSPFNIIVLLVLIAIFFGKFRRRLLIIALILFVFFSNPMVLRLTVLWWEDAPVALPMDDSSVRQIVVLGGMSAYHEQSGRVRFWQSGDRIVQALLLSNNNPVDFFVVSGGSAAMLIEERGEGAFLLDFLTGMGMDAEFIRVDSLSRNTYENAVNSAAIFEIDGRHREIALVTSAWHMPRAKRCFEKQGFRVKPIGADPLYPFSPVVPTDFFLPSIGVLSTWDLLMKEWMGIVVYWVKGYI